jgi:head-tail adaptor
MGFADHLDHRVVVNRPDERIDELGGALLDEYGQAIRSYRDVATIMAAIQPKSAREIALLSQAGAVVTDYTAYLLPGDISTHDRLFHDPTDCPMVNDLPLGWYELHTTLDAAGKGHHIQADATFVASDPFPLLTSS